MVSVFLQQENRQVPKCLSVSPGLPLLSWRYSKKDEHEPRFKWLIIFFGTFIFPISSIQGCCVQSQVEQKEPKHRKNMAQNFQYAAALKSLLQRAENYYQEFY